MNSESLMAVFIGGFIGFMSAFGLEAIKRHWKARDDEQRVDRLLHILYEEIEQLAELLDVDLGIVENDELDFESGFSKNKNLGKHEGQIRSTIHRLQENRSIFESQAVRLLELPEYLPNALVRFYTRLQVNCGRMLVAIDDCDLTTLRELRLLSLTEAEALKSSIQEAKGSGNGA